MPATETEEWLYWDAKATELRRTQLATVKASATKWSALLTALLGLFGAVAFAGGLTAVDKLSETNATLARVLTSLAALAALIAVFLFSKVSDGLFPKTVAGVTATSVREINTTGANAALVWFRAARALAIAAILLVVAGSFFVLWAGEASPPNKPSSVIAAVNGRIVCGQLGLGPHLVLTVGGDSIKGNITAIAEVAACP
jgi:hypothetical protein